MILHLGLMAERLNLILRGSFAGREDRAQAIRGKMVKVADGAQSVSDLLRGLESLADEEGFVLETQPIEHDELRFYFWEREDADDGGRRDIPA